MDAEQGSRLDEDLIFQADLVSGTSLSSKQRAYLAQQKFNPQQQEAEPLNFLLQAVKDGEQMQPGMVFDLGPNEEGMCCSVAEDASIIAAGLRSGGVMLLSPSHQQLLATLQLAETPAAAVTAVRFRPPTAAAGSGSSPSSLLLVAKGSQLLQVHTGTGTVISSNTEGNNKINNTAVRQDGKLYASAGSDAVVRVYDDTHHSPLLSMHAGDGHSCCGHTNTVFGLVWKPEDPQVLLSAGWDGTVQVWDLRSGHAVRSLAGGSWVCGDALDVQGNKVVTGSWRDKCPMQLWDYGSGRLLTNLPFHQPQPDACLVYAARFAPAGGPAEGLLVAGGSGKRPVLRMYNKKGHLLSTLQTQSAVHSIDWVSSKQQQGSSGGSSSTDLLVVCCSKQLHLLAPTGSASKGQCHQ